MPRNITVKVGAKECSCGGSIPPVPFMITEPTDIQLKVALERSRNLDVKERHFTSSGLIVTVIRWHWIEAVDADGNVIRDTYI